jgi:uncharacterized RDD family membrane protein YckC
LSERYDPFGRPIEGDHPWARPAEESAGLPGGFLPPQAPGTTPAPAAPAAPVPAPERPEGATWSSVGLPAAVPGAPAQSGAPAGVEFASWGARAGAYVIDAIIETVLAAVIALPVAGAINGATGAGFAVFGVIFLVFLLYPTLMLATRGGQTVGKSAVGIRVVGEGGAPMTWGRAAMREVVMRGLVINLVGSITFGIVGIVDVLWPLWDKENRSLHDHGADTWVVRA